MYTVYSLRIKRAIIGTGALLLLTGCPRPVAPKAAPRVSSPQKTVNDRYLACAELFDQALEAERSAAKAPKGANWQKADSCSAQLLSKHPNDPTALGARLMRARIALKTDRPHRARALLKAAGSVQPQDAALTTQVRFYLGIAEGRTGHHKDAVKWLAPLLTKASADELPAMLVLLARAYEKIGQKAAALDALQSLYDKTTRTTERLYAKQSIERIAAATLSTTRRALYQKSAPGSLLRAVFAKYLIAEALGRGDFAAARSVTASAADALAKHGVSGVLSRSDKTASAIGVLLPLSGRYARVGKLSLAAIAHAGGSFDDNGLTLIVRDSARPGNQATELLDKQRVVALVGVFSRQRAKRVSALCAVRGVPFLTLAPRITGALGSSTLRLLPDNTARAYSLADRLTAKSRVVILAPESRFGHQLARDFATRARSRGARILATKRYSAGAVTFTKLIEQLARYRFNTLFVPDSARRLALIAPALAQHGLWSRASGQKAPRNGRAIMVLSTADGLTAQLLTRAGRYLQGAVFSPGYYALESTLASSYRQAVGNAPTLVEAYAHDALLAIRTHLASGATTPGALLAALRKQTATGLSGKVRFDKSGRRATPMPLYQVQGAKLVRLNDVGGSLEPVFDPPQRK
jgi:ABC-type branched-subunit amino acid transport system substrate-binding protein